MFEREPITAGELMDKQFLPKSVIVEGMLPAGTYILAGTPETSCQGLFNQIHKKATKKCQKHFHAPDTQVGEITCVCLTVHRKDTHIPATGRYRISSAA